MKIYKASEMKKSIDENGTIILHHGEDFAIKLSPVDILAMNLSIINNNSKISKIPCECLEQAQTQIEQTQSGFFEEAEEE